MNIRELMEALSQFDPDTRVVVAGYEGGFNDITQIQPCEIRLNVYQDWFYGSHAKADDAQIQQLLPNTPVAADIALKGENHIYPTGDRLHFPTEKQQNHSNERSETGPTDDRT